MGKKVYCQKSERFNWDAFKVLNNQWGKYKVKKGDVDICIQEFAPQSDTLFGWTFQMPQKAYGVVAYPEIMIGGYIWEKKPISDNIMQISEIETLTLDYESTLKTDGGKMNLAMDIWVSKGEQAHQEGIQTEIMIWEYQDNFRPNGKKVGVLNTSEGQYEIRIGDIDRKEMGLQWEYVAFKRVENRTQGVIPIDEMLDYLLQEKIISSEEYISSIEMGTELSNANGSIYFTRYDLQLISK